MPEQTHVVETPRLYRLSADILERAGLDRPNAELVADVLVDAERRGIRSHGLMRLPVYAERLERGGANPRPALSLVVDAGAVAVVDGEGGLGPLVADRALRLALERAAGTGVSAVGVRRGGHMGTVGYYTRKGARRGLAVLGFSNSSPVMAPWNGRERILGNNPWSIAVPADPFPICLDMASSLVARGRIQVAAADGSPIPEGWAVDAEGRPTTDPVAALAGALSPAGGHKGYATAVLVELLAAVLTGAAVLDRVGSPRDTADQQDVGHLFIAVDVARFCPLSEFGARAAAYAARLRASQPRERAEITMPGELEERLFAASAERISLGALWDDLSRLAERYGLPVA